MANLIIIVGLSASGKKSLMETRFPDYHPMNNVLIPSGNVGPDVYRNILEAAKSHDKIVVSDVEFCRQEKLYALCHVLCQRGIKIKILYYANNPAACKHNAKKRNTLERDEPVIDRLSKVYDPPDSSFCVDVTMW
jgi:hypothetical protein